ncbi:MAG TPA: hypothetical protein VEI94_00155 [Candidatus Bathyarchaeia archaeon]|nr:hypothetical protein [Candidatus Bathyarchaeia archaeon]
MPRPDRRTILVLGLMGRYPMAGVAWQALQYLLGLARLGYEVYYAEDSGAPPYNPELLTVTDDAAYNVEFLRKAMDRIGLGDRWIYWDERTDRYHGLGREALEDLYRRAGSIWNICGATRVGERQRQGAKLVYVETDPVVDELRLANGDPGAREVFDAHDFLFTYGENLGTPFCPVPLSGYTLHPTRPPVLLDLWESPPHPAAGSFSTIATWENRGKDVEFRGELYRWSKHQNFLDYLAVPLRCGIDFEVAIRPPGEAETTLLRSRRWRTVDPFQVSRDLDAYVRFIQGSRGEFTVAKDIYVRPRSGWFSDRSVCYLAAGRPVITQETGFSRHVPQGLGLLSFSTLDEACAAVERVEADYLRHARAAREIAREYFAAERVLRAMVEVIGI